MSAIRKLVAAMIKGMVVRQGFLRVGLVPGSI